MGKARVSSPFSQGLDSPIVGAIGGLEDKSFWEVPLLGTQERLREGKALVFLMSSQLPNDSARESSQVPLTQSLEVLFPLAQ